MSSFVEQLDQSGAVAGGSSYLDRGGEALVSSDGHATILPLVLAPEEEDHIENVAEIVERADGAQGFSVDITGEFNAGRDFEEVSADDLSKGELQFGLPAAMIVLLLVFGTLVGAALRSRARDPPCAGRRVGRR